MKSTGMSPEAEALLAQLLAQEGVSLEDKRVSTGPRRGRPPGSKNKTKGPVKLVDGSGTTEKILPPRNNVDTQNLSKIWIIERPFAKSTLNNEPVGTVWQYISGFASEEAAENALKVCSKECRVRMVLIYGRERKEEQELSQLEFDTVASGFQGTEA